MMKTKYNKVMVVDDNLFDIYCTSRMIIKNNFAKQVIEFTAAEDAIDYLVAHKSEKDKLPTFIFLDIYMPRMDGFQFIDKFRELDSNITENCKICVLSSTVSHYDIQKIKIEKGIALFVSKPITKEFIEKLA